MFGYVLPPLEGLPKEESERFRKIYCGLCHTLGKRCGTVSRLILNYDFTFLAILLSDGSETQTCCRRCMASPFQKRRCLKTAPALELAADESVILAYWQVRDGVADHGFFKGLKYRLFSAGLKSAYRKAAQRQPDFDANTRAQLLKLSALERENCPSLDAPADTFAQLLAAAADRVESDARRRVLRQMLYHLGRWIYLTDAADDLKEDFAHGSYNPLIARFALSGGELDEASRREFTATLDHSIHMIATAYELWNFGSWSAILQSTVYDGLFQVGRAVLDGTFHTGFFGKKKEKIVEETA